MRAARRTQNTSSCGPERFTRTTADADRGLAMRLSIFFRKPRRLEMLKRLMLIFLVALPVRAEVVRVEVTSRADVLAGKSLFRTVKEHSAPMCRLPANPMGVTFAEWCAAISSR